jgi:prepilin-type N-terminal cleavage/methylation domain-containing protein/prepilin-type processing-associated H-X9-DG protein
MNNNVVALGRNEMSTKRRRILVRKPSCRVEGGRRGFTLVELLVVIAIIALLMSILMPALAGARKQAQGVLGQSNLHGWGLAFQLFAHDNEGYFPKSYPGGENYWMRAMLPYVGAIENQDSKAKDIFLCPSARKSKNPNNCNRCPGTTFSPWGPFPQSTGWWDAGAMGSYGINEWCSNPTEDEDGTYWWYFPAKYAWRSPDAKGGAGIVPVLLDCLYVDAFPLHTDEPPLYPEMPHDSGDWSSNAMQLFCIDRHNGGINALFIDYSVRKVGLKELWKLKWHRAFKTNVPPPIWPPWMRKYRDY